MCSTVSVAFETFFCLIFKLFIAFLSLLLFDFAKTKSLQMNISMFFGWCFLNDKFSFSLLKFFSKLLSIILHNSVRFFCGKKNLFQTDFQWKKCFSFFLYHYPNSSLKHIVIENIVNSLPTRATNREGW